MPDEKRLQGWLSRVVAVRPREARALLWSFAYFFCLLAGYYVAYAIGLLRWRAPNVSASSP